MNKTITPTAAVLLKAIPVTLALLAPLFIFFDTARSIVSIWNSSETFAHGYIIAPIALWMIWQRRKELADITPKPYWPALLLLVSCGFAWLLAEVADVQVVRQYALVAMVPLIAITVLGIQISWTIAFPLFFLLLAVPFGEIFIDPLIRFTANFTVTALQITGIPVYRDGNSFVIPSGSWSVVTACSGVRYLIASVTLGCLYAYLTYRSFVRRAMFVALSIVVPILANGLRAYMIVMIGHLSGMTLAVGVDHLIYGWVFFGLVMLLMFWIGSFWREDTDTPASGAPRNRRIQLQSDLTAKNGAIFYAATAAVICIAIWPAYANYIYRAGFNPTSAALHSFPTQWQDVPSFTSWKPRFSPANAELHKTFAQDNQKVGLVLHYYRNQDRRSMLISSTNQLVSEEDEDWRKLGAAIRQETIAELPLSVRETRIEGKSERILAWNWYWIDGRFTVNDYLGKLLQAKEKLLMRGDDGASITIFAPYTDNADEARSAMRNFLNTNMPSLEATLDANKRP